MLDRRTAMATSPARDLCAIVLTDSAHARDGPMGAHVTAASSLATRSLSGVTHHAPVTWGIAARTGAR
jgi:hypothetical protein